MNRRGAFLVQRGTIAPLVVASLSVLFSVLAFSVDQGIAFAAKASQENELDSVRESLMSPSRAFVAKNSENPGHDVAYEVGELLRKSGFGGEVDVWFFEVPAKDSSVSRRFWGIAIQVREESPTLFARGLGVESIPVASKKIVIAEPFSDSVTWRPDESGNGRYSLAESAEPASLMYERLEGIASYPAEMQEEVQAAKDNAKKNGQTGKDRV